MSKSEQNYVDWKNNAYKSRIRVLIDKTWSQIISIYTDKSVAIHTVNVIRSKGAIVGRKSDGSPIYRDPYFISDEEWLKILESYREELDMDALESVYPSEDE